MTPSGAGVRQSLKSSAPEGGALVESMPLRQQTIADLISEVGLIGDDYPNYAGMSVHLPCGHWRELAGFLAVSLDREAVARIIDPFAFRGRESMIAYCLRAGETQEDAERYATASYPTEEALAKADAILALAKAVQP